MTDRRGRKKLATRRAIQEAALRLAIARGADKVTVEAISDAADIARSTFFTHFASKDDALTPAPAWPDGELAALVAARPAAENALTALGEALAGAAARIDAEVSGLWPEFFARNPGFVPRRADELTAELTAAATARAGSRDRAELAAAVALGVFWTLRRQCARDGEPLEPRLRNVFAGLALSDVEE
ncbi:MAG TPA: helix-turn-helix domain-containing protein [Phytomonospora sp.]